VESIGRLWALRYGQRSKIVEYEQREPPSPFGSEEAICPQPAAEFCSRVRNGACNPLGDIPVSSPASHLGPRLVRCVASLRNREPGPVCSCAWDCWNFLKKQEWPSDCTSEKVFSGIVWRIPPEGYDQVADDIVREFLAENKENPETLDRGPSFKTLLRPSGSCATGEGRPHEPGVPRVLSVVGNHSFKE
jgi:hypothetical protein